MKFKLSVNQAIVFHVFNTLVIATIFIFGMLVNTVIALVVSGILSGMYLRGLINVLSAICFPSHQDRPLVETVYEVCGWFGLSGSPLLFYHYLKEQFRYIRPYECLLDLVVIGYFVIACTDLLPLANVVLVALAGSMALCGISRFIFYYILDDTQFWSLNHLELSFNGAKLPSRDLAPDPLAPNGAVTFHLYSSEYPVGQLKVLC